MLGDLFFFLFFLAFGVEVGAGAGGTVPVLIMTSSMP